MGRLPALLLVALLSTACAVSGPGANPVSGDPVSGAPVVGQWGGGHVALLLSASGGSVEYDCGGGTLDAAVVTDAKGNFRAPGRHERGHGGPEQIGVQRPSFPAIYEGRIVGDRMQLRVRVGADTLGPFMLRRDADPQLLKCL